MTLLTLGLLAAAPHTVAVDLTALDRQSYQELDAVSLERSVVVRFVQEGFAVVAATAQPAVRIAVTRKGRGVLLAVGEQSVPVELEARRLREFHLEVAQKAVELARAEVARLPEAVAVPPEPAPPTPEPKPEAPPVQPAPPPAPSWNVLLGAGGLLRAPGADLRVALAARYAATQRIGAHLELGLSPIPGPGLSAYDGTLQLGAGLQLIQGVLRLELGLSLGAMLHVFTVPRDGVVEQFGSRIDFLARPFLRATVNPVGGLLVWLQLGAGLASRAREHRLLGVPVYARGALWLDGVLGIGWET